jgi:Carboxypeptidase regulatory-like domain
MRSLQFCPASLRTATLALVLLLIIIMCVGSVMPAFAQSTNTGTVVGTVTDATGAAVSDATVSLTDASTKIARNTNTNSSGRYIFVDVEPGDYALRISKQGFSTAETTAEVKVGNSTTLNISMQVGGGNTVVEVTAVGTELQVMNATVGNTVDSRMLDALPSIGRDVSTFVELQPGVSPEGSVAGTVNDQSFFSLDGGNNSNDMDGNMSTYTTSYAGDPTGGVAAQNVYYLTAGPTGVLPTPQDSVDEFKVNTAGQTADFNSSSGAEVKVVTKRGTNSWHGTAYEYYLDNNWSTRNANGSPLPDFHYSRFGGAIGGPVLPKDLLGGKTYLFFNYEGFRFPNSETIYRDVPSPALQLGLITDPGTGNILYNLNNAPVTYNGTTYGPNYGCSTFTGGLCDPLAIGINPTVQSIWNKYEPASNSPCYTGNSLCDALSATPGAGNVLGYTANVGLPLKSNFAVTRLDHDFSKNWHFMSSWRYYNLKRATDDQIDIGGFFSGDTLGNPVSQSSDPQQAFILVAGLTTNISSNVTNDLHYSFLRNWWQWARAGDVPQVDGLGGALEIFSGQSHTQDLGPFNVNTQQTRTRFWDGHDQMIRDDISMLHGNHLFQFGGQYQHNFNWHQRTDNGGGINYQPVYELGLGASGSGLGSDLELCTASPQISNCPALTSAALGIVSISQVAYTRSGSNLQLNQAGTPAFDKSTIPYYNVYFSDTWHLKKSFTFTYGLGWALEMPPVEAQGKQVEFVDGSDQPISTESYLTARKRAAESGQVYNPEVGFALVGNTGAGLKYPYNPYYGEFSPRVALAWNPHFASDSFAGKMFGSDSSVLRGGYGRIYGRLNGVDLVLVPLLGTGLIQPVQCFGNLAAGPSCGAAGSADPSSAFRIGVNGLTAPIPAASPTLPQPDFPGYNAIAAGAGEALDPNFRPNVVDSFDLTLQRQVSRKMTLELGYIGRRITHEYQPININAVPYMMTMGGQQFSQAYANVVMQYCNGVQGLAGGGCAANAGAVTPQPFFESALAGTGYCSGFTSCTAAVVANEGGNLGAQQVWTLWSDLDAGVGCPGGTGTCTPVNGSSGGGFAFPRSMMNTPIPGSANGGQGQLTSGVGINASVGHGNYNAGFASLRMADWNGLTMQSNFTWSRALGTGALVQATSEYTPNDAFDLDNMYGRQFYDRKFVFNTFLVYSPPFYKGQQGVVGRALGGWTVSPVFTAGSGQPIEIFTSTGDGQEFGAGDNENFFGLETAVPTGPISSGKAYKQPDGSVNIFKNGIAAIGSYRNPVLGFDTKNTQFLNGLPYWNLDFSIRKNVRVTEGISLEFQSIFTNILNHNQWLDPWGMGLFGASSFGVLPGSAQGNPGGNRTVQLGARVRF